MIARTFNLFLNAGMAVPVVIYANQNDEEETWLFNLFESKGLQYIPSSAVLVGLHTNGSRFSVEGAINTAGQVVIDQASEITAANGKAICEMRIDDDSHGTANFYLIIEKSPLN